MKAKREEIIEVMSMLKNGANINDEGKSIVYFSKRGFFSYNEKVFLFKRTKLDTSKDVKALDIDILIAYLSKLKSDEVILNFKKDRLQINQAKFLYVETNAVELKKSFFKKKDWESFNGVQRELDFCALALPKEAFEEENTYLKCDGKYLFATDDHRLSMVKTNNFIDDEFFISHDMVALLRKYKLKEFSRQDDAFFFKFENGVEIFMSIVNKQIEKDPKDFLKVKGKKVKINDEFLSALNKAMLFATGDSYVDKSLLIGVEKSKIVINAENYSGKIKEEIEIVNKNVLSFRVNPNYLYEILKFNKRIKTLVVGDRLIWTKSKDEVHVVAKFNEGEK